MSKQGEVDLLFDVRNSFYIGNYQQCINEAQKVKPTTPIAQLERDVFLYRSYIAQKKYRVVLDEIKKGSDSDWEIEPLRTLAEYFSNKNKSEDLLNSFEKSSNGLVSAIVAGTIFCHEKEYEQALKVLDGSDHLECIAMKIQCLLRIDRVDLAKKELKLMQEMDEDSTLTQLAQAWLNIAMGGERLQDAYYIFQELIDKYGSSAVLLNGQAVALIGQGKYEEAESALQEAMDKDSNDPDTLLNMMVLSQHLGKPLKVANRYQSQLTDSHSDHHFVLDYKNKETEFERLSRSYSIDQQAV